MVNWDLLVLIGYDPGAVERRVQITTGSGVEYVPRIPVRRIESLHTLREDFPLLCHTLPPTSMVDGLLGLDFLRNTNLQIDFKKGAIQLQE